jgi:hypothetical protein
MASRQHSSTPVPIRGGLVNSAMSALALRLADTALYPQPGVASISSPQCPVTRSLRAQQYKSTITNRSAMTADKAPAVAWWIEFENGGHRHQ